MTQITEKISEYTYSNLRLRIIGSERKRERKRERGGVDLYIGVGRVFLIFQLLIFSFQFMNGICEWGVSTEGAREIMREERERL